MELGKLTARHLRLKRACRTQVELFQKTFPDGFVPSRKNFLRAAHADLDICWAADNLLDGATADKLFTETLIRRWDRVEEFQVLYAICWWGLIKKQTKGK